MDLPSDMPVTANPIAINGDCVAWGGGIVTGVKIISNTKKLRFKFNAVQTGAIRVNYAYIGT